MATLSSRSAWAKFSVFRNQLHFSPSKRIYIGFWLHFEISASELTLLQNFNWNDTKNGSMTSHFPLSDDVNKIFMASERFSPRLSSWQVCLELEHKKEMAKKHLVVERLSWLTSKRDFINSASSQTWKDIPNTLSSLKSLEKIIHELVRGGGGGGDPLTPCSTRLWRAKGLDQEGLRFRIRKSNIF